MNRFLVTTCFALLLQQQISGGSVPDPEVKKQTTIAIVALVVACDFVGCSGTAIHHLALQET